MTDNEIIKTLEDMLRFEKCKDNIYGNPNVKTLQETLDLINRQKAEIEKLKAENENQNSFEQKMWIALILQSAATNSARTEAIKEFAERLKEALPMECRTVVEGNDMEGITDTGFQEDDTMTTIDNLVKEMVGDTE